MNLLKFSSVLFITWCIVVVVVVSQKTNNNIISEKEFKTLHGNVDPTTLPDNGQRTIVINAPPFEENGPANNFHHAGYNRQKRDAGTMTEDRIITKINHLNDGHRQLMVHWAGEKSRVVICLARDAANTPFVTPSKVYISYDDGDTYQNRTEGFRMPDGEYATLAKFYNHPKFNSHFVFTDVTHNILYVTTDYGNNITRIPLNFTPSEVSFHSMQSSVFVVLDKVDPNNKFWITEDFGKTFRLAHEFVKSFHWLKDNNDDADDKLHLIVQRYEPNNMSSIIYSNTLFKNPSTLIYATNVKDFFMKGDYLFTTKNNAKGELVLYVSYKMGKQLMCIFDSPLKFLTYFIVDVTGSRALVAASHTNTSSNLYVSENLGGNDGEVRFTLSLEDVLAFLPGSTWQDTWLHHVADEAFADVYKVEGLQGIYIASRVTSKPSSSINSLGPQHLASVITFDHGATWRPVRPPARDIEGQTTSCLPSNNCSLHLSQKFGQLFPETRWVTILSSKSAPGIIMATGVIGSSLKGHYGVYISLDAGLTWHQTLRGLYFFNMGDHGGILTAVEYFKSQGETRHIEYSIDEGETWNKTAFHNEELKLYGLMTEPGENKTIFTMFGSLPEQHQWIIVKVDLKNVFNSTCTNKDYKMWSPSQSIENRNYIPCVLGEQVTYQRRMPHALCLNGLDFVRLVSKQRCDCDYFDFECDFGYIKVGNPSRCILNKSLTNYDPYRPPSTCKPGEYYNRTKGYRKIAGDRCLNGFDTHFMPDQVPCPIKEMDDFLLFAQRERISRFNLISKVHVELPVKNIKNVIAIDFDLSQNCVYWADIALDIVARQCFSNGSESEILVSTDLASIEGMALDWISKTLYFVDGGRAKIELIKIDINHSGRKRRTILNSTVLHKPRGIALHPPAGYMFWTDWSSENPSINRANLDGSNNLTLFGRDKVQWPNGITIDYIANRIYWVDAHRDYIGSSDLHGDGFQQIVANSEMVAHPFAIAVFKNNMYWDDWKKNSIFSADKDTFKGVEVIVKQLPGLMDLKVFAHGLQFGTNACSNSTCPYICVGLPKNQSACLCPDGLTMKNGKCTCPGDAVASANLTCPSVGETCGPDHFTCNNHVCVPKGWRCDGEDDCGDNSDELRCAATCPPSFFECASGDKCIPNYWKCDYDNDCADGSDEIGCPKPNCTTGQFACENGRCISGTWRCDGENDCRDGSDERNCNANVPTSCKSEEFECKGGSVTCIPFTWICDQQPDCRDGSDEDNCANNKCSDGQFSCGAPQNRCIYSAWVCDGDKDCPDGRDETNCTTNAAVAGGGNGTTSVTTKTDIPGGTFTSKNNTCQDWMFKCSNIRCIPFWWKCDGIDDCGDGSDEIGCANVYPNPPAAAVPSPSSSSSSTPSVISSTTLQPISGRCRPNQYRCASGKCIYSSWICDGMNDCPNGEDEADCDRSYNCTRNQFKCVIDGSCINLSSVCDGLFDCPDSTDESSCQQHNIPDSAPGAPATPSCSAGLFPCDDGTCHPLAVLCDGKIDCKDGYDEMECDKKSRVYQVMQMEVDEREVNETAIGLYWWSPKPTNFKLEYMPAISKIDDKQQKNTKWENKTWTQEMEYEFTGLEPFTKYNMTVYVRMKDNATKVYPPAKYFIFSTNEGHPSEPWNVTVRQRNGSHILISWNKPHQPRGIIKYYEICWSFANSSEFRLKLTGNETSHLLSPDFQHNVTYTFWVIAHNSIYASNRSEPAHLVFDGETNVSRITNIKVLNSTEYTLTLTWKYDYPADGFNVSIFAEETYPDTPVQWTKTNYITLHLAPGAEYRIEINAFKNGLIGPTARVNAQTTGQPLPRVNTLEAILMKDLGTTVKLSWEMPKYRKKVNWLYGIYYGITREELFKKPRYTTMNKTATISNLEACEIYTFSIALVGPLGYGPISSVLKQVITSENPRAPPKKIQVTADGDNPLKMRLQFVPSCPTSQPKFYIIKVIEKGTTQTWHVKINADQPLTRTFDVLYGGIYEVSVATNATNATYSQPVVYHAPPVPAPYEVKVPVYENGSFVVWWKERQIDIGAGRYKYEVLVQDGIKLNETLAQKFVVDKPPFVYTNLTAPIYTFAVRIKTGKGLNSQLSEMVSKVNAALVSSDSASSSLEPNGRSSSSLSAILVPCLLIMLALIGVVAFLVVRNRRLHSSFTRFSNSHYDTRSDAATFDNNGLDDEDSPQIRGFSDDEPLVIA